MRNTNPSLKQNFLLSILKAITTVIFPLITFKYASNILTVTNLGKVNYAASINSIFTLIASLGIATYAIREFSPIHYKKKEFQILASQVFTINIISTILSYIIYFLALCFIPGISDYYKLCLIFSLQLILNTLGTDWLNVIFEDYFYITIRGILIQLLCLLATFLFINEQEDYLIYAFIILISTSGYNLINLIYIRKKYFKVSLTNKIDLKKHLVPIFFLFSINIATIIFVNSDMILLGYILGDYYTGLYSVASKAYLSIKQILLMCITVFIPRVSYLIGNKHYDEANNLYNIILNGILTIAIPAAFGLVMYSKDIILLISDSTYLPAQLSFSILSITLVICSVSYFISSCIMVPMKMEMSLLRTTSIGAIINIFLNIILIPLFFHIATAITTFISELAVLTLNIIIIRKITAINIDFNNILQITFAVLAMIIFNNVNFRCENIYTTLIYNIIKCIIVYFISLLALKNWFALMVYKEIIKKIRGVL